MGKIISFMHISLDGSVAGRNGEMTRIKVDEVPEGMPSAKFLIMSASLPFFAILILNPWNK